MAVGAAQASIDRLVAVADQANDELQELKAEIASLEAQPGVDVTAAKAAADRLSGTLATFSKEAAEIPLTGDQKSAAEAAALAGAPEGSTVLRSETDAQGAAAEVHLLYPDGSQVTVKLDASNTVTEVVPGDDDTSTGATTGTTGTPDPGTVVGGAGGPENPNAGTPAPGDTGAAPVGNTDASGTTANTGDAGQTATP